MNTDNPFYIKSQHLQLVEPLMQKYFDYDSSMFIDEIQKGIENSGIDYITFENGIPNANYLKTFYENPSLAVTNRKYPYIDIAEEFPKYFGSDISKENAKVYLCLSYIRYIYYKEKEGLFQESLLIQEIDLEYQSTLHKHIYPEMLSLYRMILESKQEIS